MPKQKRILLADDEAIFLKTTSNMLQENGYTCDCVTDADSALEMLRSNDYDLLISDIKMPGNSNMELISNISKIAAGIPVILVTAYPSIDNAIQALKLHVCDYLLKPIDFGVLLKRVNELLKSFSASQDILREINQSIGKWREDLENMEKLSSEAAEKASLKSFDSYLDVMFKNMFETLMHLKDIAKKSVLENDEQFYCNQIGCVKLSAYRDALAETVKTLKRTRNSFKSKELGELRGKLEKLLAETS